MIYLLILVLIVVVVVAIASQKPDDFVISRSTTIKAKPEVIFSLINDFHEWEKWSPYEALDADLKKTFSGSKKGVGAIYEYDGKKAGAGKMEITKTSEPNEIVSNLTIIRPMQADNIAKFTLEQKDDSTIVTWSLSGHNKLVNKIADLILNIDKLVGKDFEKGLADLKRVVEGA
jgi:hypothetical protein